MRCEHGNDLTDDGPALDCPCDTIAPALKPWELADACIQKALDGALNHGRTYPRIVVDENLVDAFTSRLLECGVLGEEIDDLFYGCDPDKIDAAP